MTVTIFDRFPSLYLSKIVGGASPGADEPLIVDGKKVRRVVRRVRRSKSDADPAADDAALPKDG